MLKQVKPPSFALDIPDRTDRQNVAINYPVIFEEQMWDKRFLEIRGNWHTVLYVAAGLKPSIDEEFEGIPSWIASVGLLDPVDKTPRNLAQWSPGQLKHAKKLCHRLMGAVGNELFEQWRLLEQVVQLKRNLWSWEIHELRKIVFAAPVFDKGKADKMLEIHV